MKFSYNWLKELSGIRETPKELGEFLALRVFEIESMERKGKDWMLDIKVLPNRVSDASGHAGMAAEIAALKKRKSKVIETTVTDNRGTPVNRMLSVIIDDSRDCSRYTARIIEGVRIGPSPQWLTERLEICGLQSINNVVDAANYVMLELGQPLHVFDYDKLASGNTHMKTIRVRRAKKNEEMIALDDKTYCLDTETLVIADQKQAIAIAGIKGGKDMGISEDTRTLVLESAHFNPLRIRLASQALRLKTDASYRFEHGMDPNQTAEAIDRLAHIIQKIAGGTPLRGYIDVYPKPLLPRIVPFRPAYADQLIGQPRPAAVYEEALERIGCQVKRKSFAEFLVSCPTIRFDLAIEEDLIEEAARLIGYDTVKPRFPESPLAPAPLNDEWFWEERVRDSAVGLGFTEVLLYQFTGERELEQFFLDADNLLALENPTSPETAYLVSRPIIKYVSGAAENLKTHDTALLFGVAKSFRIEKGVKERKQLLLALARKGSDGEQEFYELKGKLDQLFDGLGIDEHWYDDTIPGSRQAKEYRMFHPYRRAEIKLDGKTVGVIGEIHPEVLDNLKCRSRIVAAELDFETLWQTATSDSEYRPIGKYPAIIRDIAVIVPEMIKTEDILNVIENTAGTLLIDTDLFDYFQDEELTDRGEKSLAFHLIFQSAERTLTDTEVDKIVIRIIAALEDQDWEVRK